MISMGNLSTHWVWVELGPGWDSIEGDRGKVLLNFPVTKIYRLNAANFFLRFHLCVPLAHHNATTPK